MMNETKSNFSDLLHARERYFLFFSIIMSCLEFCTIVTNLASFIALLVLLIWSSVNLFAGDGNDNDGRNRWRNDEGQWEFDFRREEQAALKVLFDLIVLLCACGALFSPMTKGWYYDNGIYDRINIGVLAGSTCMFANMLFVSFWYMMNFESREDANENYNNNDNYDYGNYQNWEMNEEERLAYHQSVISYTSLALAAVFVCISILISREGANLPEIEEALWDTNNDGAGEVHNTREMEVARLAHSAAHLEMLSNVWNFLSASTIVILMVLLIATLFSLGGEDAERMKEEGQVYNLIAVLFWVAIVSFGIRFVGRQILGEKKWGGTMGVGVLSGATTNFSALLFMVFLLYSNPMFEERRPEDGPATSVALSFASLFLSLFHLAFSVGTTKYQSSIIAAIALQSEDHGVYDDAEGGGFICMDRPEMELT